MYSFRCRVDQGLSLSVLLMLNACGGGADLPGTGATATGATTPSAAAAQGAGSASPPTLSAANLAVGREVTMGDCLHCAP